MPLKDQIRAECATLIGVPEHTIPISLETLPTRRGVRAPVKPLTLGKVEKRTGTAGKCIAIRPLALCEFPLRVVLFPSLNRGDFADIHRTSRQKP